MRMLKLISMLLLMLPGAVHAVTYYIAPSGSDTNNGTSQSTPWKTIDRANQISFNYLPGDKILFQRGGEYRGKLLINSNGNANAYIEVGAYGTGAQPIISGSVAVTGWTLHSGNIWKAPLTQVPKHIFVNGALQTLARFPNSGWLRVDNSAATTLQDAELTQASGYWTGATAVIRTTNWSYDTAYVSAFSNSTLTHTSTGNPLGTQQWGYFLRNKLAVLDQAGEWYYDRPTGMLYLWCPNNANPATQLVEASVLDYGLYLSWQRNHFRVSEIHFRHQHTASLRLSGTYNLEAFNCTFTDTWQAILSTGNSQNFHHLTIARTYGTGVALLDNDSYFTNSTLTDIALIPGLGEQNMGYIGGRFNGSGMTVSDNTFTNIGYSAIAVTFNAIVERNVVTNSMAVLNDGAGITFDQTDGAIIRDNIVRDLNGNVESSAIGWINSVPMCHGIYFGNTYNKNVQVLRNTVTNCKGSGMHVDHTMANTGIRIENNVLFNNTIQLSISDASNYNSPGATAPYYVPVFNTIYNGNVMYSMNKDQLCMRQYHVNSPVWVDYGVFTNNRYYSPYNDRSIFLHNINSAETRYFALERWQAFMNEDVGSTRSPMYLPSMATSAVLSTLAVPNGTFASNVSSWTGWPSQGVLTHNTQRLDNGSLKVTFTNNQIYNTFNLNPSTNVSVQQGSLYRLKFSMVSDLMGELTFGFKGNSQLGTPNAEGSRTFPFDANRRDVEHYFTSNITDAGVPMFTHTYTEGIYYIDNISLERVTATAIDPNQSNALLLNSTATAQTLAVPAGCWKDTEGNVMGATLTLQPYQSRAIYKYSTSGNCAQQIDCAGVAGGTALPGTACNDGNACTTNDLWNANCQCVGTSTTPTAAITAGGATSFCAGGSVVLSATTGTGYTYQWRNNGTNISGATSSSYTATAGGSYTMVVTSGGCSATSAATTVTVTTAPSATITAAGPTTFCSGGTVLLNANTGTGLTYQWRKNGTNISGATASSYTATAAGSYTVVVTSGGCSATSTATAVTVNASPTAAITAGGATSFCTGGSVVLNAATGTGYTYQWRNNGTNISGATASSTTATASGSYTVVVTSGSCSSTSSATTVTVSAAPTATITAGGSTTFCSGSSVTLNANTGTGLTYQWRRNGTNLTGATASSYSAATAGSYTVVVTSGGCGATSAATTVTVNAAPTAVITAGGATSFCTGGSVVLSATTGTGYTYQWRKNGTNISGATASSYTASAAGSYTVVVTSAGCSATSAATTVSVSSAPAATITAGGTTAFCAGGNVVLSANTGTGFTYQWRRDGVSISGATAISYTATLGGAYTVVVANGGCSNTSAATAVTVKAAPVVTCSSSASTSTVSVTATGGQSPYTYSWNTSPVQTSATATVSASGTYTATVTGANGCSATCSTTITLSSSACTGIRTETHFVWGAPASGSNPSAYMVANWAAAFPSPNYLTVGCGSRLARFTTAQAVINALPSTGTVALLPTGTAVNPTTISNALLGHLTAIKISIRMDELNSSFSPATAQLKNMLIASGTFAGWTVQQLANHADQAIGGCVAQYPLVTIAIALQSINSGYQGGTMSSGYLSCPGMAAMPMEGDDDPLELANALRATAFPNPTLGGTTITVLGLAAHDPVTLRVLDLHGAQVASLFEGAAPEHGELRATWDAASSAAGMYFFEAISGDRAVRGKVIVE